MRRSFTAYVIAGLGALAAAVVAAPLTTNFFVGTQTLVTAFLFILGGAVAAALWAAGRDERKARLLRWTAAGVTAGVLSALGFLVVAGLGFVLGIRFGLAHGAWATLTTAFASAGSMFALAFAAHWLAWRLVARQPIAWPAL